MNSDSDVFTYIIRSLDKTVSGDNTSNCTIKLGGLPSEFKTFQVEVAGFFVSTYNCVFNSASLIELRADNLGIKNGYDTDNFSMKSIAFDNLNNTYSNSSHSFICEHFNNRYVNFTLVDDNKTQLQTNYNSGGNGNFNRPWILILKMKGLN